MKNLFKTISLILALGAFTAEARIISIIGEGPGGTNHGDKPGACERAYERAETDGTRQCERRDGYVLDLDNLDCRCRHQGGQTYNCHATVRVQCEVQCHSSNISLSSSGLGIDYNREVSCNDARRRAEDNSRFDCRQRGGLVLASDEMSCNCQRLNSGDYQCTSNVRTVCEINDCR